ncbi:MAG: deoxyribodipyrimidine photo-lyase, partial [Cellvibrionales bacterium]|nr:deoxyribodipyrimidine photo-lyase [Cellvibrionales bacterium]
MKAICWFRQDLRLDDNPAFQQAVTSCEAMLPVYILDTVHSGQ